MPSSLDGAGQAKMRALDDALSQLQRLNAIVERLAQAVHAQQNTSGFRQQIQRAARPIVDLLRPQFDSIAEHMAHVIIVSTRGGTEGARVRTLREGVAQTRTQIEATMARVQSLHAVDRTD